MVRTNLFYFLLYSQIFWINRQQSFSWVLQLYFITFVILYINISKCISFVYFLL